MGWFHQTLAKLRELHSELMQNPTSNNLERFHSEVERRINVLNEEYKDLGLVVDSARAIKARLDKIKHGWNEMLFMRGEFQNMQSKQIQKEINDYGKELNYLAEALQEINSRLMPLRLAVDALSKDEKREEE